MKRAHGILLFAAVVLITITSVYKAAPPAVVPPSAPDTVFSAARAFPFLQQISRAPHSMGTQEHARVRAFIIDHFKTLGLETTVQEAVATGSFRGRPMVFAGKVHNIMARLKGSGNGKAVAVLSHYDSHPNTPGAGDDGAAVAAMMETARILKNGAPLQNDVLFVFTDGEESGLIGAKAFIESGLAEGIGVVLNFEARGSAGISNMFEVNNDNGWVMEHFAKAAAHPFANSLSFEVYKLLPNDTDFTLFKKAGITGLNHAFIDHYEDYHSMHDTPENLDQRSLQHHGANMLSLTRHFANTALDETKAADKTYFNLLGSWLIMYPDAWNLLFVALACLLGIVYLVLLFRKKQTAFPALIKGLGVFILALISMALLTWLIQKCIAAAYPYNNRFYDNNAYNSKWYFLAVTAAGLCVFSLIYQWALRRINFTSLYAAILVLEMVLMILMKLLMPTATYLFCFPVILSLAAQILLIRRKEQVSSHAWVSLLFAIPAILLFAPTIYAVFIAFGLGPLMPGGVVVTGLLAGLLLPVLGPLLATQKYFLRGFTIAVFLFAVFVAHRNAFFTQERPLPSNLWYLLDADKNSAQWISDHVKTDAFNKNFLQGASVQPALSGQRARITSSTAAVPLPAPVALLQSDSSGTMQIHCMSSRNALSMFVTIAVPQPIISLQVDGKEVERKALVQEGKHVYQVQYYALPGSGFTLALQMKAKMPVTISLTDRTLGIPGVDAFPSHMIPGEGRTSYTTQVKKTFRFE